ncbi:hypothetical protein PoB_005077500 [Plakobranchus ocellatus]|uniref:Uncharacterized protein n=1 Tax=Plakobranchus ocellatus TaxID=259542 RepID=A0AAV4BYP4_9GAST|nr:hypothetical protein PoB_005077500 [Plakobranchus ocellatus]
MNVQSICQNGEGRAGTVYSVLVLQDQGLSPAVSLLLYQPIHVPRGVKAVGIAAIVAIVCFWCKYSGVGRSSDGGGNDVGCSYGGGDCDRSLIDGGNFGHGIGDSSGSGTGSNGDGDIDHDVGGSSDDNSDSGGGCDGGGDDCGRAGDRDDGSWC